MSVNGSPVEDKHTANVYDQQAELIVECYYDNILHPTLTRKKLGSSEAFNVGTLNTDARTLTYSVPEEYREGTTVYHCFDPSNNNPSYTIEITVSYRQHPPPSECVCAGVCPSTSVSVCVWECVRPPQ